MHYLWLNSSQKKYVIKTQNEKTACVDGIFNEPNQKFWALDGDMDHSTI